VGERQEMRLQIELSRRDVHDVALLRRRMYDITHEGAWIDPHDLSFLYTIVDRLYETVKHYRSVYGFTWNEERPEGTPEEDRVGPSERKPHDWSWADGVDSECPEQLSD